ncbi:N-acetylglucosamine-6-phosphate deacetylase [Cohnella herbarum]|uniref:Amidohydrolase family protein n=1 Tax=Cohnella herbarum TaxID=2728023 RepID=A0A7Z2ZPV7_9BACL|nr:amidohydrolase family protein [Cohnella herbarum]QJD87728.1 amidohydrolase family protein [Cohnella herbarum]
MKWRGIRADTKEIVEISSTGKLISDIRVIEGEATGLPWISAGWIDLQVNGIAGYDFNGRQATLEDVEGVTRALHGKGVAAYLPTVITGEFERMRSGLSTIAQACRSGKFAADSIVGIHVEGPYLSGEDGCRGAHPREQVRDPDWNEFLRFQDAAEGRIKMVTLAPERAGAIPFIEKLVAEGVVVAIGHTMASGEQIADAVRAGATLSTHLGNGSQTLLPRHPNYIWHQLAEDRLWATFIPDGHHLAPPVLKAMLRAKLDKAILVSDCVKFGGMKSGRYESLIGAYVELREDGRLCTVENPDILAGSAYTLDRGITNALLYSDMDLSDAIDAVSYRPAQVLGATSLGRLEEGASANFTIFEMDDSTRALTIRETVVSGETVYRHPIV